MVVLTENTVSTVQSLEQEKQRLRNVLGVLRVCYERARELNYPESFATKRVYDETLGRYMALVRRQEQVIYGS